MTFLQKTSHPQQQDLVGQGGTDWQDGRDVAKLLIFNHQQTRRLVMIQDVRLSERHCGGANGVACTWNSFHKPPRGQSLFFLTTNVLFHYSSFQNTTRFHICLLIWAALSCVGQKLGSTISPVIIQFFDYFAEKNQSSESSPQIRGPVLGKLSLFGDFLHSSVFLLRQKDWWKMRSQHDLRWISLNERPEKTLWNKKKTNNPPNKSN